MIWGINDKRHTKYGKFELIFNNDGSVADPEAGVAGLSREATAFEEGVSGYAKHGIFMYLTWFVMALTMFCLKRYFKTYWFVTDILHIVMGSIMTIMTMMTTYGMIDMYGVYATTHSILGFIMLGLVILLGINGTASALTSRYG
jgi:hypothetical protein